MKRTTTKRAPAKRRAKQQTKTPAPAAWGSAREIAVSDIMTTDVVTVSADLSLRDAVDLFADRHLSGAPVVSGGAVVGVLSAGDLLGFEASTPGVPTERTDQSELGEWEAAEDWVEDRDAPAAFFTEMWTDVDADVVERFEEVGGPEWDILAEHTVAEAMNRRILAVSAAAAAADAATYMVRAGVHRLLVRDGSQFVGIVTTTDIVRAVAARRLALTLATAEG